MNFAENAANQVFTGGELIGPTNQDSSFWNSSINFNTGNLANGEIGSTSTLINSTGASTTATVNWASNNVYYNSDGTTTDQYKLSVGYLDDSTGVTFTVSNIPYTTYTLYLLFTSDQAGQYQHGPTTVNGTGILGGGNFNAFGQVNPGGWVLADGTAFGNYAIVSGLTGPSLTVNSTLGTDGARGPITGFVLVDAVPEPSSAILLGLGSLCLLQRRRK